MELARRIMQAILSWIDMLNCHIKVGAPCTGFTFLTQLPRMRPPLIPTSI